MLGYMTESKAKSFGFTHHGEYYGIPIWMTTSEQPMIAAKWVPFEFLMTLFHWVEGAVQASCDMEPCFVFKVTKEIR